MKSEQISTDISGAGQFNNTVEDTEAISSDSQVTKKFYEIKAIESGGLDVEIVGINLKLEYQERAVVKDNNIPRSLRQVQNTKINNLENADFSYFYDDYDQKNHQFHHQCVLFEPVVDVYFRTHYDDIYVEEITISKTGTSISNQDKRDFLNEIKKEIYRKQNLETINDVRPTESINAKLKPDSDLKDGKLEINKTELNINATKVKNVTFSNDDTSIFNYICDKNVAFKDKYDSYYDHFLRHWYWGHISDLRYDDEENNILIVVKTPIHKTVFKFNLNHNTDSGVWKFINQNGGCIEDLRGMDVCVRERAGCLKIFEKKDLRISSSEDDIGKVESNQPIETLNKWNRTEIVDSKSPVEPIGVDINRVWDIGIPPHDKFTEEHINTEKNDQKENNGIISVINRLNPF